MNPTPHRSATFWCGLMALVFLLGAWVDSTRIYTDFVGRRLQGVHQDGALDLMLRHGPGNYHVSGIRRQAFTTGEPRWFAPFHWQYATGHFIRIVLPHWLLLLAVALPWLGLLLWRAHRRQRTIHP